MLEINHRKQKKVLTVTIHKLVNDIRNKTFDEFIDNTDNLEGEGVKIIIPSNIIDTYTRLEILLGLNFSGHSDTLTEASNLKDDLYKRGEKQNEQQYGNLPHKFHTIWKGTT